MSGELSKINPHLASRPGWLDRMLQRASHVRSRWRLLKPIAIRAMERIAAARGTKGKLRELHYLASRARNRLRRRAALSSAQQATVVSTNLSQYLTVPEGIPECRSMGGGMLAICLPDTGEEALHVTVRDRFGVSYSARQIGQIERTRQQAMTTISSRQETDQPGMPTNTIRIIVQVPLELLEQATGEVEALVQGKTTSMVFNDVALDNRSNASKIQISVDNNLVMFSGTLEKSQAHELNFGLFVDDEISSSVVTRAQGDRFNGAILIDPRHLDGMVHHLALRELPHMATLASTYEFLPLHITPWDALQSYARAPLDGTLAPAARHHFRSYQLWLDKLAEGNRNAPPIGRLYAEILHGFRKRQEYPPLEFPVHERPTVSVVIPVHNKIEVTYLCLCSLLFAYNDVTFEVIVVDDGSTDETIDIATFVKGIRVLRHETSQGFVASCNTGAAVAKGDFIAFLNNDVEATARWLDELIATCRNFDGVGLTGSKLVYPDGRLQEAGGIIWGSGDPWNVGRFGNAHDPRYNYLRQADYVSGAALMLPREVWTKVGGFSAEFAPGYFEDTDLAMKVREAGYLVAYVPTSTVIHFEGKSSGTDTASGMKRFQEINRPKFKQKWGRVVASHGAEGVQLDREKDRAAKLRILFLDHQFPMVDGDAGSYAAFQEIRLFQSLGAKVTFLPRNLAWMDRHTVALQRIGVECLYGPYVTNYADYIRAHAQEFDAIFVCRYQIAQQVIPLVRASSPSTKIIFNLADLHFLRELREAAAGTSGFTRKRAEETRVAELAVVQASDLTFSYSEVELAVLESHLKQKVVTARLPWVVESNPMPRRFAETKNLLFLGGFTHLPNAQAVKFFADDVMPALREQLPEIRFDVVGKGAEDALAGCSSDTLRILGHVADLDSVMARTRIFVAPLLAGAGLKGKVMEAVSRGVPCVLSPIAAEGTGLVDGINCLIADSAPRWIDRVQKLYSDETLWSELSRNALRLAETKYSFPAGVAEFEHALSKIGIEGQRRGALVYRHVRPMRYGV